MVWSTAAKAALGRAIPGVARKGGWAPKGSPYGDVSRSLWELIGRPTQSARGPTYRGQPFPPGASTLRGPRYDGQTFPSTASTSRIMRGDDVGLPRGTHYNPGTGGYRDYGQGGVTRGTPRMGGVDKGQHLMDPSRYNAARGVGAGREMMDPNLYNAARNAGFLNRGEHPRRFWGATAAGLGAGAVGLSALLGREEEQMPGVAGTRMPNEWSPPPGMPSYEERVDSNYDDQMRMLKEIVMRAGIISSFDKKAGNNYFDTMKTIAEETSAYNNDKQVARITDAVLTSSGTPAQIYKRMTDAGESPDEAMAVSGHQVEIRDATVGDMSPKERVWQSIVQVAMSGDIAQAAKMLANAWGTGLLGNAPMTENYEQLYEMALQHLTGIMEGDPNVAPGMGSGITDISPA